MKNNLVKELTKNGEFSEQIDKYIINKLPTGTLLYLGNTPKILQDIGVYNNPVILKQSKLKSILAKGDINSSNHNLTPELIKSLVMAIEFPLNILKSSTEINSIVIITDLIDLNENLVVVIIHLNDLSQIGNIKFLSNRLSSVYGKRNYELFMKREIKKENLLYDIDVGIIKELPTTGLQLSKGISPFNKDNIT